MNIYLFSHSDASGTHSPTPNPTPNRKPTPNPTPIPSPKSPTPSPSPKSPTPKPSPKGPTPSPKGPTPKPSPKGPTPSPIPPGKWEGWATLTMDGQGDWTGRFCGSPLKGVPIPNNSSNNAGAAVPWTLLCKEFKSKNCMLNHMCPSCYLKGLNCNDTMAPAAKNRAPNCSDPEKYNNGINSNGICWEAQILKNVTRETFNANNVKQTVGAYKSSNSKDALDLEDDSNADTTKTYTLKLSVGCGGNCLDNSNTCSTSVDCVNECKPQVDGDIQRDPCSIQSGNKTCDYLIWTNNNSMTNSNMQNIKKYGSCRLPFNITDGKFSGTKENATIFPNWCSGAHMNFDLTNTLNGIILTSETNGNIVRYRKVKCPE